MKVAGYEFSHIGPIDPMRSVDGKVKSILPQNRYANKAVPLHRYGRGPFCTFRVLAGPWSGIYGIEVDGRWVYIGRCIDLRRRFNAGYGNISPRNCYRGGRETNCRLNALIYGVASGGSAISLWFHETNNLVAAEDALIRCLKPEWNRAGIAS
jgi:hypothetical protein